MSAVNFYLAAGLEIGIALAALAGIVWTAFDMVRDAAVKRRNRADYERRYAAAAPHREAAKRAWKRMVATQPGSAERKAAHAEYCREAHLGSPRF